jgi:RNA polymerase sigma-70 factor (ECF subfamily)
MSAGYPAPGSKSRRDVEMSRQAGGTVRRPEDQEAAPRRVESDRQLVEALRLGEATAAERLVATYGDRAYRMARRMTGSEQDAEEVVQDALWAVVRKIETFRGNSAFGSWLYRIVANAAYQKLLGRHGRRADVSLDEVLPFFDEDGRHGEPIADWSASVEDPALRGELRAVLSSAIDELPEAYRTVVLLHDVEGFANREIGETLRISIPNVKSRVHRARLFLRKRLADYMSAGRTVECLA